VVERIFGLGDVGREIFAVFWGLASGVRMEGRGCSGTGAFKQYFPPNL
jgi:hypothetical protein